MNDYSIILTLIFTLYIAMTYLAAKGERKQWADERKQLYAKITGVQHYTNEGMDRLLKAVIGDKSP